MSKLKTAAAITLLAVMLPAGAYALADICVFGGYSFNSAVNSSAGLIEPEGHEYGGALHLTYSLPLLTTVGLGGFGRYSDLRYNHGTEEFKFRRTVLGIDGFARLDLPGLPVKPYAAAAIGAYDRVKAELFDSLEYFMNYSAGGGLMYEFDLSVMKLNFFAEYFYNMSIIQGDKKGTSHAIHIGTKAGI